MFLYLALKFFFSPFPMGINSASVIFILSADSTFLAEVACLLIVVLVSFAFQCSEVLLVWW